jgi:hypothetical protein
MKTGCQWMHVNVQIVLVGWAGHAEKRQDPQPEDGIVSLLVVINRDWLFVPFIFMLPKCKCRISWRLYFAES